MGGGLLQTVVDSALWATERPVWFSGVRLRARTTILRLDDGGLLVHSPAPPTEALDAALEALGPVRWLVVPNLFHQLAAPAAAERYPDAKVVGPPTAKDRNAALTLDHELGDGALAEAAPELSVHPLGGVPFLDETVLFHRPTGTLIGTDLVMSACAKDHWTWRWSARLFGVWGKVRTPPDVKWKTPANDETKRSIEEMLALPIERIVVAHADPIEERPKDHLAEAWRFVGV